jgi:hypothetical protein
VDVGDVADPPPEEEANPKPDPGTVPPLLPLLRLARNSGPAGDGATRPSNSCGDGDRRWWQRGPQAGARDNDKAPRKHAAQGAYMNTTYAAPRRERFMWCVVISFGKAAFGTPDVGCDV